MPLNMRLDVPPVWRRTQILFTYPSLVLRLFLLVWNLVIKAFANGSLAIGSNPICARRKSHACQMDANHCCFLTGLCPPMISFTEPLKSLLNSAGSPSNPRVNSVLIALSTASNSAWWIDLPFTWTWELRSIHICLCKAHIWRINLLIQIFPDILLPMSFKYLAWYSIQDVSWIQYRLENC